MPLIKPTGEATTGYIAPTSVSTIQGAHKTIGAQHFTVVELTPGAAQQLQEFRTRAARRRLEGDHGAMWARAFEHAVKLAALAGLGEAIGTEPWADPGRAEVAPPTAAWAISLVEHAIEGTLEVLGEKLADYEAERIQKSLIRAAEQLQAQALADPDPKVENSAPPAAQQVMRDLKLKGWFLRRELVRKCSGDARSSRDVATEIDTLVEGDALAQHVVTWKIGKYTDVGARFSPASQEAER